MSNFFSTPILDVAVGLVFVYLTLSILCSAIHELIAGLFSWRAKQLEAGIKRLLHDPQVAAAVLGHPLLRGLAPNPGGRTGNKPEYIPASIFTLALFDALRDHLNSPGAAIAPAPLGAQATPETPLTVGAIRGLADGWAGGADAAKQPLGKALLSVVNASQGMRTGPASLGEVQEAVERFLASPEKDQLVAALGAAPTLGDARAIVLSLPPSSVRASVLTMIDSAQRSMDALRAVLEAWFDNAMARVSAVYSGNAQVVLFVIGLALSALVGADSLRIVNTLWTDQPVRDVVVKQAESATGQIPTVDEARKKFDGLGVLFGYDPPQGATSLSDGAWWKWFGAKVLGICLTAIAASLGAPFWFDVLVKVANIRAGGKPPKPSEAAATTT